MGRKILLWKLTLYKNLEEVREQGKWLLREKHSRLREQQVQVAA